MASANRLSTNKWVGIAIMAFAVAACQPTENQRAREQAALDTLRPRTTTSEPGLEESLKQQGLVDIQRVDSTILVELKYSTTDNFFGQDVYAELTRAYLQPDVAEKLKEASQYLQQKHPAYRLLVYDAVRPHHIQKVLWEAIDSIPPKRRADFVADPARGSIHNYGCAIDLTVFDTAADTVLDMGTKYDYFGELAYPRLESKMLKEGKLTQKQVDNRLILREVMKKAGFMEITSEWWHFNSVELKKAESKYLIVQ